MTDAAATQATNTQMAWIEESLARLTNLITPRSVSPVQSLPIRLRIQVQDYSHPAIRPVLHPA
jgi:hypothetical protein